MPFGGVDVAALKGYAIGSPLTFGVPVSRTRPEPWKSFADWLTAERGLGAASCSTYLTQVRRMITEASPLTNESLADWIAALPSHHRSPHRTAWRCYVAWSAATGADVPDLVAPEPLVDIPASVLDALSATLLGSHLRPRDLATLTWGKQVSSPAKEAAFPDKVFFTAPPDVAADYALLPRAALAVLREWAHGEDIPPADAPLVPRAPGDGVPMAPTTIQRLLRERRRAGA